VSATFDIEADGEGNPGLRTTFVFEEVSTNETKVSQRLKLREPSETARQYLAKWISSAADQRRQAAERLSKFLAGRRVQPAPSQIRS
jgi:hypothetical protein